MTESAYALLETIRTLPIPRALAGTVRVSAARMMNFEGVADIKFVRMGTSAEVGSVPYERFLIMAATSSTVVYTAVHGAV